MPFLGIQNTIGHAGVGPRENRNITCTIVSTNWGEGLLLTSMKPGNEMIDASVVALIH